LKISQVFRKFLLEPCGLEDYSFQLDPFIGCEHYCLYCYALNNAQTDWKEEIFIHERFSQRLEQELSLIPPQPIYLGMNSDPYQPLEESYPQTRIAIEILQKKDFSVSILTKSPLVLRDIELLRKIPGASVGLSFAFHDEEIRKLFEAKAPPNSERLESLKALKEAGIKTYALICPVMPFFTDLRSLLNELVPCADTIWLYRLRMGSEKDPNWRLFSGALAEHYPELWESYRQICFYREHPYWLEVRQLLEEAREKDHLNLRIRL
jgi:DNA repair photolyase